MKEGVIQQVSLGPPPKVEVRLTDGRTGWVFSGHENLAIIDTQPAQTQQAQTQQAQPQHVRANKRQQAGDLIEHAAELRIVSNMPAKDRKKLAAELRTLAERLGSQAGATTVIDKSGPEMKEMRDGLEFLTLRSAGGSSSAAKHASPSSSSSEDEDYLTYR